METTAQNEVYHTQRMTHRQTMRKNESTLPRLLREFEGVRYLKYHVVIPPDTPNGNEHSGNANETHEHNGSTNGTPDEDTCRTNTAQSNPVPDALQSSSVDQYPWGEGSFEPAWSRWRDRPTETLNEDKTWGGATHKWERNTREKVITQGGSPPPKLRSEENLFVDNPRQHVPWHNLSAFDNIAFRTGSRQDGIVSPAQAKHIPTHPNPFASLQDHHDTYRDFIPESDPEEETTSPAILASASPKATTSKGKRIRSLKEDDITAEERDLSMYRLSDDDSDSSLTIYYKAFNKEKPEMNESNEESVRRTQAMEKEIKRLKAERRKKRKRKKPTPENVPPNTDKGDDSDEEPNAEIANYPPTRDPSLPRTYADFLATASAYSGHPAWDLCSPKEFYLWTKGWEWTPELGHFLPEHLLPLPDTITNCPQHILLDTQHLLYANPQPTTIPQTIEVLHDTGASICLYATCRLHLCPDQRPPEPPSLKWLF
jgi:hypothetical protein